eukprot:Pompholyxophrys_punicea_v1_NODE_497_length_1829_cov_624.713562.p3 type:complete len:113 gc:universal NODE_497_length_1829_cov_624.713562:1457-1119(-)
MDMKSKVANSLSRLLSTVSHHDEVCVVVEATGLLVFVEQMKKTMPIHTHPLLLLLLLLLLERLLPLKIKLIDAHANLVVEVAAFADLGQQLPKIKQRKQALLCRILRSNLFL